MKIDSIIIGQKWSTEIKIPRHILNNSSLILLNCYNL